MDETSFYSIRQGVALPRLRSVCCVLILFLLQSPLVMTKMTCCFPYVIHCYPLLQILFFSRANTSFYAGRRSSQSGKKESHPKFLSMVPGGRAGWTGVPCHLSPYFFCVFIYTFFEVHPPIFFSASCSSLPQFRWIRDLATWPLYWIT